MSSAACVGKTAALRRFRGNCFHSGARKSRDGYGNLRQGQDFQECNQLRCVDSLIQHQASSLTHGTDTGLAENLLRLSVGLEHSDDLIDDLQQAVSAASGATHERL